MARFSLAVDAGVVLVPGQTRQSAYQFSPVSVTGGDPSTQAAAVLANFASLITSKGSLDTAQAAAVSTVASGTGSVQVAAVGGSITALEAIITSGSALANTLNSGANHDVVVSINAANITTVTELRRAFDHLIRLAQGGVGGLTP